MEEVYTGIEKVELAIEDIIMQLHPVILQQQA